jgi:hypothetical protein
MHGMPTGKLLTLPQAKKYVQEQQKEISQKLKIIIFTLQKFIPTVSKHKFAKLLVGEVPYTYNYQSCK